MIMMMTGMTGMVIMLLRMIGTVNMMVGMIPMMTTHGRMPLETGMMKTMIPGKIGTIGTSGSKMT